MEIPTTNNKVAITAVVTLSAALALITVKVCEQGFGLHLNGETPVVMGSFTVIYHAILNWIGISDLPKNK